LKVEVSLLSVFFTCSFEYDIVACLKVAFIK
jgi:hypothetical protein